MSGELDPVEPDGLPVCPVCLDSGISWDAGRSLCDCPAGVYRLDMELMLARESAS